MTNTSSITELNPQFVEVYVAINLIDSDDIRSQFSERNKVHRFYGKYRKASRVNAFV